MKAYHLTADTGIDSLARVDLPDPKPAAGQVLIRIRAVSLNFRDLMIATGHYGISPKLPLIPVSDGAGEIVAVGEGVSRWHIGDRVAGAFFQGWISGPLVQAAIQTRLGAELPGVLAELVALSENGVVAIPPHLSFEEAATLPCAAVTAWQALVTRGNVSADETVLVLGTGGVSLFALQFAKLHGARVIVTSSSDEKLARARSLGADATVNYRTLPDWDQEVLRLTDGVGVDHVVEVGGKGTLPKSLRALAMNGTVSVIGGLDGFTAEILLFDVLRRAAVIRGIAVGSRGMHEAMHRAIARSSLRPTIDQVFPFAEAPEAYRHLQSGRHFGKIVIAI